MGISILLASFIWIAGINFSDVKILFSQNGNVSLFQFWKNINFFSWQFLVYLLININVLAVFVPSKKDYKNIAGFIVFYILVSIFVERLDSINIILVNILLFSLIIMLMLTILLSTIRKIK